MEHATESTKIMMYLIYELLATVITNGHCIAKIHQALYILFRNRDCKLAQWNGSESSPDCEDM